jgi:tripartite-type tricarboxylate transporter receptor subunit TctC
MPRLRDFGLALFLALFFAVLAATAGRAQDAYPTRVVKIVVPSLPGSTTDILARLVGNQLSEIWGKPVIVENMAGAAMAIGAEYVSRAAPDGYTLLICPPSPVSIQHLLYHDLKYDPLKFTPIAMLAKIPNVLVVRPDFPANTIQELIAYGKANPGKLTYASQGAGSTAHLSGSELELLGGEERSKDVPEIPTIAESGLPGFRSITWFPIVGPPGMPPALAEKINADVVTVLQKPQIDDKLRALRLEPMGGTPADAAKFFASETKLWGRVIKEANITLQ